MSRFAAAVAWSGRDVTFCLFVVFPRGLTEKAPIALAASGSYDVREYELEDIDHHLGGRRCREYDLVFRQMPVDIEAVVMGGIAKALAGGAEFAWFGFEGSFDFHHILTKDVVDQIYAVGTGDEIQLALDDAYRGGPGWAARVQALRVRLLL